MRLAVFGADGQVGRELRRRAPGAVFLTRAEADLSVPGAAETVIRDTAPEAVINAAAFTDVDGAETEPETAHRLNADAPAEMAAACAAIGAAFVHLSTDYVFGGTGVGPQDEAAAIAPLSVYGRTKAAGEAAVTAAHPEAVILRTSWVFSAHGRNFVRTILRLADSGEPLRIVADQVGGPTFAGDIAAAALHVADARTGGEGMAGIFHYAGGPDTSWAGFARAILAAAGRIAPVIDITTADFPRPAPRPANSRLSTARIARVYGLPRPDWRPGLAATLAELGAAAPITETAT